ncbi:undecaprenyldiphospho-muramoylpentapeptide beta-N-acetylglucosaminyltransferase [Deferribacter thermophilus]|uniref:undecaprenyldiphospho-muramoylpentapeptide beta-N-acetylglucosaminyltransferase n=1 Tax=Deferribacter thermophilus TaxID=53573 RepID=UPI003C2A3ADE
MKIIIAGGGTGGHLFPGVAVAQILENKGVDFMFLVSNRGIDKNILSRFGYKFYEQNIYPFKGKSFFEKIKSLFMLYKEFFKVNSMIKRDDKVLLLGGFASVAAGVVSIFKGVDLYVHEQNSVMGLSNRFFSKFSKKVFLSFENTKTKLKNVIITGNPVRKEFYEIEIKKNFEKKLLIVGGSQGSRIINHTFVAIAKKLLEEGYEIFHQTGDKLYEETLGLYEKEGISQSDSLKITPFIEDIVSAYKWADIVISRAGAGAVFELLYSKRVGIFVPLKIAADNHQYFNALYAKEKGVAEIILEDELNNEKLLESIHDIGKNYPLYIEQFKKIKKLESAELIVKEMLSA